MKMYLFGNSDNTIDKRAFSVAEKIAKDFHAITFETIKPNQDVPFENHPHVFLMDVVVGLKKPTILTQDDIHSLELSPRGTVHDYDLGFQLKYLLKLKKINKVTIVGLPAEGQLDYPSIHEIFKKLVAHDIQGS